MGKQNTAQVGDINKTALIMKGLLERYQIGHIIGKGSYAAVRLCFHKELKKKFAVKIYEKHRLADPMKRKAVQREITVMKRLNHPGVVGLHDLIDTPK